MPLTASWERFLSGQGTGFGGWGCQVHGPNCWSGNSDFAQNKGCYRTLAVPLDLDLHAAALTATVFSCWMMIRPVGSMPMGRCSYRKSRSCVWGVYLRLANASKQAICLVFLDLWSYGKGAAP